MKEDNSNQSQIRKAIDVLFPKLAKGEITYWDFTYPLKKEFNLDFNDIETYALFTPEEQEVLKRKYTTYQIIRSFWKYNSSYQTARNAWDYKNIYGEKGDHPYYIDDFFAKVSTILDTIVTQQNFETTLKPYLPKRAITTIRKRLEKDQNPIP